MITAESGCWSTEKSLLSPKVEGRVPDFVPAFNSPQGLSNGRHPEGFPLVLAMGWVWFGCYWTERFPSGKCGSSEEDSRSLPYSKAAWVWGAMQTPAACEVGHIPLWGQLLRTNWIRSSCPLNPGHSGLGQLLVTSSREKLCKMPGVAQQITTWNGCVL